MWVKFIYMQKVYFPATCDTHKRILQETIFDDLKKYKIFG